MLTRQINNENWVNAIITIDSKIKEGDEFIDGTWKEGIFRKGSFWHGYWHRKGIWISGFWVDGVVNGYLTQKSPKAFRKPKKTLSLNFAVYS